MNAAAAQTTANVYQKIYSASQKGEPTAFLPWHATPGIAKDCDPRHMSLLHSIRHYASRMGRPARKWDNRTFLNRGDVSYGTSPLEVWDPTPLHLFPSVYVPSSATIDISLTGDPNVNLLGPYGVGDARAEMICCCNTVYIPAPYIGLLLSDDLTPLEAWNRLHGAIDEAAAEAAAEAACHPIIEWLHAAIVRYILNTHSALVVPDTSEPLPNTLLLQHRLRLILSHLPGLDPSINRAAATRISKTVVEVAMDLR